MEIILLTRSRSLARHVAKVTENGYETLPVETASELILRSAKGRHFAMIHTSTYSGNPSELLETLCRNQETRVIAASDTPNLADMLTLSQFGLRGYFNSYMADVHYRQMLRLVLSGQTWFPPALLAQALELARRQSRMVSVTKKLARLTPREKDVASAVAGGLSNKRIANTLGISERTVKTHLTHVFEKLGVSDRVSLAIGLNSGPNATTNDA